MKIIFILITAFHLIDYKGCKNQDPDFVIWNESIKLVANDFKGTVQYNDTVSAGSAVRLKLDYKLQDTLLQSYDVVCLFIKSESWIRDTTTFVLSHEQGHFDIGEIVARRLRKELLNLKNSGKRISGSVVIRTYNDYIHSLVELQNNYDKEIKKAGIAAQNQWNENIRMTLDSLKVYK